MENKLKIKLTNSILLIWGLGIIYTAFNLQKVSDITIDAISKNEFLYFFRAVSIFTSAIAILFFNLCIRETQWKDAFLPSFLGLVMMSFIAISLAADDPFYMVFGGLFFCVLLKVIE